jgi:hypothetical protein
MMQTGYLYRLRIPAYLIFYYLKKMINPQLFSQTSLLKKGLNPTMQNRELGGVFSGLLKSIFWAIEGYIEGYKQLS